MGQVIWAPSALEDVDSIAEYIARDSAEQAALVVTRFIEATQRLAEFPLSGRILPEIGDPSCGEIICGPYCITYRLEGDDVWITGIVHGARDWGPHSQG